MNKSNIKNFAVRARVKLIEDTTQKAYELGITNEEMKGTETFEDGFKIAGLENGRIYKKYELNQREKLVSRIKEKGENGFEQVIEEVAYTWFNRLIALRFMEVNEYLPTGVRVLSSTEEGKAEPDIIKEALNVDLELDRELVYKLIDSNDTEDLYKYLLVKQCNELGKIMPMVFEEISDYTELLLSDQLLLEGSVIRDLVESIEEEEFKDQVEIIGWMYQYYISEKKDEVFADLKKNKKITKENIPAATQLFTPKWIVKYMVENSLGRLWLESHPDDELQSQWKYYLEEAVQDQEVQKQIDALKDRTLNPEDIKVLDPCMGSGHILVYAFDVLYDIYLKANYSERDIPQQILEENLYGLDIDDRAAQLASFALMMKARSKNRRIFRKKINLNVYSIQESNSISKEAIEYFCRSEQSSFKNERLHNNVDYLIEVFKNAKEYGSILDVQKIDFDAIEIGLEQLDKKQVEMYHQGYKNLLLEIVPKLIQQAKIISKKYEVVCTNPPYMGSNGMNITMSNYVKKNYPDSKNDLSAIFIEKCGQMVNENCYQAMITQHSWMFLFSFEKLRGKILRKNMVNMVHLGTRAFEEIGGEVVQTTSFVLRNTELSKYHGNYVRLVDYGSQKEKESAFLDKNDIYIANQENFSKIPRMPIAYWASKNFILSYVTSKELEYYAKPCIGLQTSDTKRFLRIWSEVDFNKIGFNFSNLEDADNSGLKWFPYNKGGGFRRWYGNNDYIVNWENDGFEIRQYNNYLNSSRASNIGIANTQSYFKESGSWGLIGSSEFSVRYSPKGFIFDTGGPSLFANSNILKYLIGLLNCKLSAQFLLVQNPTLNFPPGSIASIPTIVDESRIDLINRLVKLNIEISKTDWDSFETSWDFTIHPLIKDDVTEISRSLIKWKELTENRFKQLKNNEEELNRIFIDIYRLQDEISPDVEVKNITIRKVDIEREIKSFISYAVGCIFGRYSLDQGGLVYAGGVFEEQFRNENSELKINSNEGWKKSSIKVTLDNIIPIVDDDYFGEDIVNRFVEFVKISFSKETLEENLDYIAETLGNKSNETSRQTIRRYFLKEFYKNHLKTYSKRPIYWLIDSGKENGFKALIYMHRYDSSTMARVRTDYLHKLQKKYEAEVKRLDILIESDISAHEKATAIKKKDRINKQIRECLAFDQVIAHVANQKIEIDLDDGVKVNYAKFQGVEIPQGDGKKPLKADLLAKI